MGERRDAIYSQWGSCWIGRSKWFSMEWGPSFALLLIYRDELVLRTPFRRRRFPRDNIQSIHRCWTNSPKGLQIEHGVLEQPPFVVFWSTEIDELEQALDANAFPVATLSV